MILVDPLVEYPQVALRHKVWCHMVSDKDVEELHAMAKAIGLKRSWFQSRPYAHYDITPPKRAMAVARGAEEVTARHGLLRNFDYIAKKGAARIRLPSDPSKP